MKIVDSVFLCLFMNRNGLIMPVHEQKCNMQRLYMETSRIGHDHVTQPFKGSRLKFIDMKWIHKPELRRNQNEQMKTEKTNVENCNRDTALARSTVKLFFRRQTDDICRLFFLFFLFFIFFYFNKLLFWKTFIRKVERLNVKQRIEPSHLDLCCLQKPIIMPGSERVNLVLRTPNLTLITNSISTTNNYCVCNTPNAPTPTHPLGKGWAIFYFE